MRKLKKIGVLFLFLLAVILAVSDADTMQAAAYGYTDHGHAWETPSKCNTCGGDHVVSVSCTTCGGDGKVTCSRCIGKGYHNVHGDLDSAVCTLYGCSSCGGSGYEYYLNPGFVDAQKCPGDSVSHTFHQAHSKKLGTGQVSCGTCGGDGVSSSYNCSKCYASGTYKGKNTRCTNASWSGCGKGSYAAWGDYPNGVCYTTANTYTQTINHYLWNADTSAWDYWTTTYATATYATTYTPSYTTTPNGYYNYDITWKTGWTVSGAGTFSAYYYPNTYYVTYDANGGSDAPDKQSFLYKSTTSISSTVPIRTGYTFNNWWATHTTSTMFAPGESIPKGWGSFTLQAKWTANSYNVNLIPNGGSCSVETITPTFDTDKYCSLNNCIPVRAGYEFLGWYTAIEGGTQVYGADGNCTNEGTYFANSLWKYPGDINLYAQWKRIPYTITYDVNGGNSENAEVITYYDEPVDLSLTAEKDGYVFVGWNTDPNAVNGLPSMNMPESDITLYAIYSIPVSDIREVYLMTWLGDNIKDTRTFQLERSATNHMLYTYSSNDEEISAVLNTSGMHYQLIAKDYAGNYTILKTDGNEIPLPDITTCLQTVEHYLYDVASEKWVLYETVSEEKLMGERYTPVYLTDIPSGYRTSSIDDAYTVSGDKTNRAEYVPIEYTLNFDANGGSVSPYHKMIYYGDVYGELPTPERKGYSFKGWYTEKEEGTQIVSSMKYEIPGDSTIYAHWELNQYKVTYDYWTNGGTYASASSIDTPYGTKVDLSVTAVKNGYTFVGWNTDPDAKAALDSLVMEDKELVLYAIYKKDITATFIDSNNGTKRTVTTTVYNNQTFGDITIPAQNSISGWTSLGWSLSEDADAPIDTTPGTIYTLSENLTFYGCYVKEVTLSYDANGSSQTFVPQVKERYYNAYGNYSNPTFTIAAAPILTDHSFVAWVDAVAGYSHHPGEEMEITEDTLLIAQWDRIPEIEAYDRYFTTEEAQNGEITPDRLLEKVIGTDKEDGILINGEDVIVLDYNPSDFLTSTEVEITYQATDSFGNTAEKTVTVHIVDTTVKVSPRVRYVRFISSRFYADENGSLLAPELGGLETTSIWRSTDSYKALLESALYNKKVNEEYKTIEYFGTSTEVKVAGSGEWQTEKSTWVFTKDDIKDVKEFVDSHGYGNVKEANALELFIEAFRKCLKLN